MSDLRLPLRLADSPLGTILDADGAFIARAADRKIARWLIDQINATPSGDLRNQLAEALTREHYRRAHERIEVSVEEHCAGFADAVMPVIEPLAGRLRQAREIHRQMCYVADGQLKRPAYTCSMCDVLDQQVTTGTEETP
jgi:hypothetical protein